MRDLFRGYYKPTTEEFAEIWKNCTFCFDANVLLNIYRYTPKTRSRFLEILTSLQERIWLPHQAAYEYQKNRVYVISKYVKVYEEIETKLTKKLQEIKTEIISSYRHHPFISTEELLSDVEQTVEKLKFKINEAKANHPNYLEYDQLREVLTDLFADKVGQPYSKEELDNLYQEAEKRFNYRIPPGYKDANKPLPRSYGDVIIWFQLIDYAKAQQKPLIFVTDDNKEDWWLKFGRETLEPRPELIQEILSAVVSEKFQFYMYHSDRFLDCAANFLGLPGEPEVAQELREIMLDNLLYRRIPVESRYLRSIGYDSDRQILEIEFQQGDVYQYRDVPATAYAELMSARSHGSYFNSNIKDNYSSQKIS